MARPGDDGVLRWNAALLAAIRSGTQSPPVVARGLAVAHTCMYDAWAAYDARALGTRTGGGLRRPRRERRLANKARAVSFAAYRAAGDLFPASRPAFEALMAELGYRPDDRSLPARIGNRACAAVLRFRHHDGSNQLGDLHPGPYTDYTGYAPANDPMDTGLPLDPRTVHALNRWQPLRYVNGNGTVATPSFAVPQWGRVRPFAAGSSGVLRTRRGPARVGSKEFRRQARELLSMSAHLNDRRKLIAEYWADGAGTELPPGHWNLIARLVSHRRHYGLGRDAKLFFALNNALFDAGIVAWADKRAFDSVRPITAIRALYLGKRVQAWGGPGHGTATIWGGTWFPYQATTFPTPPFPEYSSGHSTFSAAGAEVLRRFTGSDRFGHSAVFPRGSSRTEPGMVPRKTVILSWPTFSAAADQAGISRRYGGIHFRRGDLAGRRNGRIVGRRAWAEAERYFRRVHRRNG
jgi:hypothetical protein